MNASETLLAVANRIPVIATNDETPYYIVAIDPASEAPTNDELEMISLYQRFAIRIYNDEMKEALLKMPLPIAQGHNTTILKKEPFGDWSYRRRSRPKDLPMLPDDGTTWTLHQALNDAQKKEPHWNTWKLKYSVFRTI